MAGGSRYPVDVKAAEQSIAGVPGRPVIVNVVSVLQYEPTAFVIVHLKQKSTVYPALFVSVADIPKGADPRTTSDDDKDTEQSGISSSHDVTGQSVAY